ncbi:MAG TPA: hypothetical protein VIK72_09420 [Clostridiaceae bacterium]
MASFNNRVGEVGLNKEGKEMKIIDYQNCDSIIVCFTISGNHIHTQYGNFKRGGVTDCNYELERIGEVNNNTLGSRMEIIKYINSKDIVVKFDNGFSIKCSYGQFKSGELRSPYDKTTCNVGYFGEGEYKVRVGDEMTKQYYAWGAMMHRCYYDKYLQNKTTYKDVTVCKEWHNFQNFAKWHDENYYTINEDVMHLDKDILIRGNKIYSPETCVFVSQNINSLFLKSDKARGEYPIGVGYRKDMDNYSARCGTNDGGRKDLGYYNTPEKAFSVYKVFKEQTIKNVADKYKEYIPPKLYDAMYKYIVDIND